MRKLFSLMVGIIISLTTAEAANAQVGVRWNVDIERNDANGRNYNAHTMERHVGTTLAEAREQARRQGKKCVGIFWTAADANYYINDTLNEAEELAAFWGTPGVYETFRDAPLYYQEIISKSIEVPFYYGIYIRELDGIYNANSATVLMKKIPEGVVLYGALVESAYPDLLGYSWCS